MEEEGAMRALAVAVAAAASAWNTHHNGFVWDDRDAIVANKDVRAERALWQMFTHDFWGTPISSIHSHKSYRPLTVLSLRLNYWTSGGDTSSTAQHFHVGNILIHVGCSLLVWEVAQALFLKQQRHRKAVDGPHTLYFKRMGAVLAALLFAVHPIHCDAVASVVGRADLLCTTFSLLAFLSYVKAVEHRESTKWSAFVLAIAYAVAASLCKELGFTVFGLFLAYDLITKLSSRKNGHSYYHTMKRLTMKDALSQRAAALVLVTLALTIARVWINGEHRQMKWNLLANNVAVQSSRWTRALSYAHIHAWYLWKLLWPRSLCFDYGFKTVPLISTIWDLNNLFTLIAYSSVAGGVYAGVKQLHHSPVLLMSIAFGVVPFIPASNLLFPVGTIVAERLLYFPSVGFCLLVAHVLQAALDIAYKYGSASIAENTIHSTTSYSDMSPTVVPLTKPLKDAFRRSYALMTLATWSLLLCGCYRSQLRNAEWASETTLFHAAFKVSPTNNKVLANVGKTLLGQDDAQAIRILKVATAIVPQQDTAHTNLGLAHWNLKHSLFATRHLHKAVHFSGDRFQDTGYLGGALFDHWLNEHQTNDMGFTREAFLSSPTIQKARMYLDLAIAAHSYYPVHYYTRARLAYFGGDFEDAIRFCELTLRMNDTVLSRTIDTELLLRSVGQIYNLMAISYSASGRRDLAIETITRGLQLAPNEVDLHANAVMLYADHRRDRVKGNEHLNEFLRLSITKESTNTLLRLAQQLEKIDELQAATLCRQRVDQLTGAGSK